LFQGVKLFDFVNDLDAIFARHLEVKKQKVKGLENEAVIVSRVYGLV
jgi:hypothetical protein